MTCCLIGSVELFIPRHLPFACRILIDPNAKYTATEEQARAQYKDNRQNLIMLAIAILGALSAIAYNRYGRAQLPSKQLNLLVSCWTVSALSVFSGILGNLRLQKAAENRLACTDIPFLSWPAETQVLTLIALLPFALIFATTAFQRRPH